MSVAGIEAIGAAMPAMPSMPTADVAGTSQLAAGGGVADTTGVQAASGATGAQSANGVEFGNLLTDGLDRLQGLQNTSSNLAVQAATGDSTAIHDYTIAATEASTATSLAVSLKNSGVQAFNQIMSMQV